MKSSILIIGCVFWLSSLSAQPYTPPTGKNSGAQNISNVTFQGINNTTRSSTPNQFNNDFYDDYTNLTNNGTAADAGGSFSLSVTTFNQFSGDPDSLYVWIDWNQDGIFDTNTETAYSTTRTSGSTGNEFHTFNITINVPSSSPDVWSGATGEYRMRIAFNYVGMLVANAPTSPAGTGYNEAEFEDYKVKISSAPLPVKLTSFIANVDKNTVKLEWQTAIEINNSGFEIERSEGSGVSDDLKTATYQWEKVGFVSGAGNSNGSTDYVFTDNDLSAGKYLYRLKQIDYDGHFQYSDVIVANILSPDFLLEQIYPNPVRKSALIKYTLAAKAHVKLNIYNASGAEVRQLVDQIQEAGSYLQAVDVAHLPAGAYYYTLSAGEAHQTKKMIVLK